MNQNNFINFNAIFGSTYPAHSNLMGAIWGPGINVAIFIVLYSYRKYWVYLHAFLGLFVCLFTLASTLPILVFTGIISSSSTIAPNMPGSLIHNHYLIGIACMVVVGIQTLLGITTKMLNILQAKSNIILGVRKIHMIFGYMIIILFKANLYLISDGGFGGWLAQDVAFLILLIIRKIYFPKMEMKISLKQQTQPRLILSIKELPQQKDYVVFANFVYDIEPLKINHPGGYQIIQSVKNKEIDRYIYGMLPSQELPQVPTHSHSFRSLTLVEPPIAKLNIPTTYSGFTQDNVEVNVTSLKLISEKGKIYQMFLKSKQGAFSYQKYTDVSQLGQYYSISLNDKVTRLYTSVNFINKDSRRFMQKYLEGLQNIDGKQIPIILPKRKKQTEMEVFDTGFNNTLIKNGVDNMIGDEIPILFKSYSKGRFSQGIISDAVEKLMISKPKGQGLQYAHLKPGKVIIVAGGTGIYPFSDLIDLLYKDQLAKDNPELKNIINSLSPILQKDPFKDHTFQFMAAVQNIQDIHPITLHQLLYLSKMSKTFKLTLRLKGNIQKIAKYDKINIIKGGFQKLLQVQIQTVTFAKIWICGPPKMNQSVSKFIRDKFNNSNLYLIL